MKPLSPELKKLIHLAHEETQEPSAAQWQALERTLQPQLNDAPPSAEPVLASKKLVWLQQGALAAASIAAGLALWFQPQPPHRLADVSSQPPAEQAQLRSKAEPRFPSTEPAPAFATQANNVAAITSVRPTPAHAMTPTTASANAQAVVGQGALAAGPLVLTSSGDGPSIVRRPARSRPIPPTQIYSRGLSLDPKAGKRAQEPAEEALMMLRAAAPTQLPATFAASATIATEKSLTTTGLPKTTALPFNRYLALAGSNQQRQGVISKDMPRQRRPENANLPGIGSPGSAPGNPSRSAAPSGQPPAAPGIAG